MKRIASIALTLALGTVAIPPVPQANAVDHVDQTATAALTVPNVASTPQLIPASAPDEGSGSTPQSPTDLACTHTFVGASGGSWQTASNWSPKSVPSEQSVACLPAGTVSVPSDASVTVDVVRGSGGVLTIAGVVTVTASLQGLASLTGLGELHIASDAHVQLPVSTGVAVFNAGTATLEHDAKVVLSKTLINSGELVLGASAITGSSSSRVVNRENGVITADGAQLALATLENHGDLVLAGAGLAVDRAEWHAGNIVGALAVSTLTAGAREATVRGEGKISTVRLAASEFPLEVSNGVSFETGTINGPLINRGTVDLTSNLNVTIAGQIANYARLTIRDNTWLSEKFDNYGTLDIGANKLYGDGSEQLINHDGAMLAGNGGLITSSMPLRNRGEIFGRINGLTVHTLNWESGVLSGLISGTEFVVLPASQALRGDAQLQFSIVREFTEPQVEVEDPDEYLPSNTSQPAPASTDGSAEDSQLPSSTTEADTIRLHIDQGVTLAVDQLRVPTENSGTLTVNREYGAGIFAPTENNGSLVFASGTQKVLINANVNNYGVLDLGERSSYESQTGSVITNSTHGSARINGTNSTNSFVLVNQGLLTVGPSQSTFTSLTLTSTSRVVVKVTEKSFSPLGGTRTVVLGGSLDIEPLDGFEPDGNYTLRLFNDGSTFSGSVSLPVGWTFEATDNSATIVRLTPKMTSWGISGDPRVGGALEASTGSWDYPEVVTTYQWMRNETPITGATESRYNITPSDAGAQLWVVISGHKEGFVSARYHSPRLDVKREFERLGVVSVTGVARVGSSLKAVPGDGWSPEPQAYEYQWLRNGSEITGAVAPAYTLTSADRGAFISVRLRALHDGYVTSEALSPVVGNVLGEFTSSPSPKITGAAHVGATLKASVASWKPAQASFTYRWLRDGKSISGATKATYKLTSADAGKRISVQIIGKRSGYVSVTKKSASTARVLKVFTKAAAPKISGTKKVGSTLKASVSAWKPYKATITYRWMRSGKPITGATKSTYKLTKADRGHRITVKIVGKRSGYASVTKYSGATGRIK